MDVFQLADVKMLPTEIMSLSLHYEIEIMRILNGESELSEVFKNMRKDFDDYTVEFPQERRELFGMYVMMERRAMRYAKEAPNRW